jgi:hypothetical protein
LDFGNFLRGSRTKKKLAHPLLIGQEIDHERAYPSLGVRRAYADFAASLIPLEARATNVGLEALTP